MTPTIRTDEYALAAITAAAERLADDRARARARNDLTYIHIAAIDPSQRDWNAIATALGTTPAQARRDHQPAQTATSRDF
jgi:hypothetical protein